MQVQLKKSRKWHHHPTQNVSHQPESVVWVTVASCPSFMTSGRYYGPSQLCWSVLNIEKQKKEIFTSPSCMQVYLKNKQTKKRRGKSETLRSQRIDIFEFFLISFLIVDLFWIVKAASFGQSFLNIDLYC